MQNNTLAPTSGPTHRQGTCAWRGCQPTAKPKSAPCVNGRIWYDADRYQRKSNPLEGGAEQISWAKADVVAGATRSNLVSKALTRHKRHDCRRANAA